MKHNQRGSDRRQARNGSYPWRGPERRGTGRPPAWEMSLTQLEPRVLYSGIVDTPAANGSEGLTSHIGIIGAPTVGTDNTSGVTSKANSSGGGVCPFCGGSGCRYCTVGGNTYCLAPAAPAGPVPLSGGSLTQTTSDGQIATAGGAKIPVAGGVPILHSNPSATAKLIIDFDGAASSTWGSYNVPATPAYDQDGDATTFNTAELASINEIFLRVAEKYSPFDIDVTTADPGGTYANKVAVKVIVGGTGSWLGAVAGGVAYIGSFYNTTENVAYVFPSNLSNGYAKYTAEAVAHEGGHTLGLQHQAVWNGTTLVQEYNPGNSQVAPVMGNSYYAARGLWWTGTPSNNSSATQADLTTLSNGSNAFGYRADDYGSTIETATLLTLSSDSFLVDGVIERNTDADYFSFATTSWSTFTLNLSVAQYGAMLDGSLYLYNASGSLVGSADTSSLGESLTLTLAPGTYYVSVASHGGYGDIGQYTLTGAVTGANDPNLPLIVEDPSGLNATSASAGEIVLGWTDNSDNETGFLIQRSTDNGGTWSLLSTVGANVTSYHDSAVSPGTTYKYRVLAYLDNALSDFTPAVAGTTAPAAPGGIVAAANSAHQVTVTWLAATGATGYYVERSLDGTSGWSQIGGTVAGVTALVDTGCGGGTRYYYRVRAVNASGSSDYSTSANALTTPDAPGTPIVWAVSATQATVNWTAVTGAVGYVVERSADNATWSVLTTTGTTTVNDMTLSAGGTYFYRVRAVNVTGSSEYTAATGVVTPPGVPTSVSAWANSAAKITVSWSAVTGATEYVVQRSADGQTGWQTVAVSVEGTSFIDEGLAALTSYSYRVRAVNASGSSDFGGVVAATTLEVPTSVANPSDPSVTVAGPDRVTVAWADHSNNEDGFEIERSTDGGATWETVAVTDPGVTAYTDTGLAGGETYAYRVRAYSGDVRSNYAAEGSVTLVPAAPEAVHVEVGSNGTLRVIWAGATGANGYQVERSGDGVNWTLVGVLWSGETEFADTGLPPNAAFYYRVRSVNATGVSDPGEVVGAVTAQVVPGASTGLDVAPLAPNTVQLSWNDLSENEAGFRVEYSTDGKTWKLAGTVPANTTAVRVTGLVAGRTYRFRISGYNEMGFSKTSNVAAANPAKSLKAAAKALRRASKAARALKAAEVRKLVAADVTPAPIVLDIRKVKATYSGLTKSQIPEAVTELVARPYSTSAVQLTWTDNSDSELGFRIEYSLNGRVWKLAGYVGADETGCRLTGLAKGKTYTFRVSSYNLAGVTNRSATAKAVTPKVPPTGDQAKPSFEKDQDTDLNVHRVKKNVTAPGLGFGLKAA